MINITAGYSGAVVTEYGGSYLRFQGHPGDQIVGGGIETSTKKSP